MNNACNHTWQQQVSGDPKVEHEPMKVFAQKGTQKCESCGEKRLLYRYIYTLGNSEWMDCDPDKSDWIDTLPLL